MKYSICGDAKFGNENFPVDVYHVVKLCTGTFGDFEKPYYHKVLCVECKDSDGMHFYKIIGEYNKKFMSRKYFIFGKVKSAFLFGFKSNFKKEDVKRLIELEGN